MVTVTKKTTILNVSTADEKEEEKQNKAGNIPIKEEKSLLKIAKMLTADLMFSGILFKENITAKNKVVQELAAIRKKKLRRKLSETELAELT